jgi:hypothetical protein
MLQFRKEVFLHFEREALLYDIKNYCFIEGDLMERKDEHAKHQVFDVGDEGNIDRVTRVLNLAFASCVELCYPYSKKEVNERSRRDNELEEEDEYVMKLKVPNDFSETTVTLLEEIIHEYLVYKVVADWMSLTKPESEANWSKKIEDAEQQIRVCLHGRVGRVRRPLSPFG